MTSIADPMLYSNIAALRVELPEKNWNVYVNRDWPSFRDNSELDYTVNNYDEETERIHSIYCHAFYGNHPFFLLGSRDSRSDLELVRNIGTLCSQNTGLTKKTYESIMDLIHSFQPAPCAADASDDLAQSDHQVLLDAWEEYRIKFFTRGSILNEKDWWPMMNDFAMLGVIHRGRDVQLSMRGKPDNEELWDSDNNRFRVMGREIQMLRAARYRPYKATVGKAGDQYIFLPPKNETYPLTYTNAYMGIKTSSLNDIQEYLDQAGHISMPSSDDFKDSVDDSKEN